MATVVAAPPQFRAMAKEMLRTRTSAGASAGARLAVRVATRGGLLIAGGECRRTTWIPAAFEARDLALTRVECYRIVNRQTQSHGKGLTVATTLGTVPTLPGQVHPKSLRMGWAQQYSVRWATTHISRKAKAKGTSASRQYVAGP